jgi:hypothetical protein
MCAASRAGSTDFTIFRCTEKSGGPYLFFDMLGAKAWKFHSGDMNYFAMLGPLDAYTVAYTFSHCQNVSTFESAHYEHTKAT